jgi:hypothetical protein
MGNILVMDVADPIRAASNDYCRGNSIVSFRAQSRLWITTAALAAASFGPLRAAAQYQGQISNADKNTPSLRAVGVLEWTGDQAHPKTSRLVPVCVFDGQELEDAGVYMARPEPLALEGEVEYQLQRDGKVVGLFDVENSARQQGSWVGFGKWKALPRPKPAPTQLAKIDEGDAQSDEPVLHRKHKAGDAGGSGSGSDSGSGGSGSPDPDRPTLHKSPDASGGSSGDSSSSSTSSTASNPDGPTLHKGGDASGGSSGDSGSDSNAPTDPDRPTLHRTPDSSSSGSSTANNSSNPKLKQKNSEDEGYVEDVANVTDPERPRLFRGKSAGYAGPVLPSVVGLPPEMEQVVAVSDVKNRPEHLWDYIWANPDDEAKMKADMEDVARTALGLNPPANTTAKKTTTVHKTAKPAPPPPPPAPLLDEQYRVFELAYGSGATMVLSAHTSGAGAPMKFVTLVGQPDLYGNVAILVKNVTDAAHLDDTPRFLLIDAVDAKADNRGELLFELRGASQRQFALYRVLRGDASRIFVSGADAIGAVNSN